MLGAMGEASACELHTITDREGASGKVIETQAAGGADHYRLRYFGLITRVTDPYGTSRDYHYELHDEQPYLVSQPCSSCSAGGAAKYRYDAGELVELTDFRGSRTTWVYNDRGLVIRRTEAVGTPVERVTTVDWHPSLRLPVRRVDPAGAPVQPIWQNSGHHTGISEYDIRVA